VLGDRGLRVDGAMPCPWYRNGLCTSPRLRRPTASVTNPSRCLGGESEYKSCRLYTEPANASSSASKSIASPRPALIEQLKPYNLIHLVERKPQAGCPYMKIHNYSGGYLAECLVLGRLLTRSEVKLCEQGWSSCPFYRYAVQHPESFHKR